jgi:hypothetical protein
VTDVRPAVEAATDRLLQDAAAPPETPSPSAPSPRSPSVRGDCWFLAALVAAVGVVPLATALAAVRQPRWYPEMDLALTELLVRDVGTGDTPLVGLVGRVYGLGGRGYHPGPLSFWLLAPVYRVFGSTAWALQVSAAALNILAIATATWIAHRRGGRLAAAGVAGVVGILALRYGTDTLTQPWNPYIPRLWWFVFLLAAWSLLCDDLVLLPVAVAAGSLCLQTHISYLGLVGGVGGVVAAAAARQAWRCRSDPARTRRAARWGLASLALLGVLSLPPLIEQVTRSPGNVSVIVDSFVDPASPPLGMNRATVETWLSYLDVPALLGYGGDNPLFARRGAIAPGLLLLVVWGTSAAWAWRRSLGREVLALHVTAGVALAAGLASVSRVQGDPVFWVFLWAWGTTAVVVVAIGWSLVRSVQRLPRARSRSWSRSVVAGPVVRTLVAGLVVVVAAAFTYQGAHTAVDRPDISETIGRLTPAAVARLESLDQPGEGRDERYVLRWTPRVDLINSGLPYGVLLELERQGLDVGAVLLNGIAYHSRDLGDSTRIIDYARGEAEIERWRATSGTTELAYHDDPAFGPVAMFVSDAVAAADGNHR